MNASHYKPIRKFNPGTFQSDAEVTRQFVVRNKELDIVLEVIRGNIDAPSCQHILVVAPRGRGKTMLLARVAAELRTDAELSKRLFPVRFMEESQEIFTMADFWLETLFHLTRETAAHDPGFAKELQATHAALAGHWRDSAIEQHARAAVLAATDRVGKKLVLMVENLQSLYASVDNDFGWKLREVLQCEPGIILLVTATSRFKGLDDVNQPFFGFFRSLYLAPLDTKACGRLWQVVSGDEKKGREIKPLQILTGGSPRLLVTIAEFAHHQSLRELLENLVQMIDDHSEYFRGHLENIAPTERRVYLAAIDLWQMSSSNEIAARARMDIRKVSSILGRLVARGAVIVEGSGKKRLYTAAERLYSIYYKLRRERDAASLVHNLIQFMTAFYMEDELVKKGVSWVQLDGHEETPEARKGVGSSDSPEFQEQLSKALVIKGEAGWIRTRALLLQGDTLAGLNTFRAMYDGFVPGVPIMLNVMLMCLFDLITAGVPEQDLISLLSSDPDKSNAFGPFLVALRQRAGEDVRAPAEVLAVAVDIREKIEVFGRWGSLPM